MELENQNKLQSITTLKERSQENSKRKKGRKEVEESEQGII